MIIGTCLSHLSRQRTIPAANRFDPAYGRFEFAMFLIGVELIDYRSNARRTRLIEQSSCHAAERIFCAPACANFRLDLVCNNTTYKRPTQLLVSECAFFEQAL
jgi:hypothetical protein